MPKLSLKIILLLSVLITSFSAYSNNANTFKLETIDNKDSVNFDLGAAIVFNDIVEIPFFIKTDDQIFSLDFEMTFNSEKLEYLAVIDHTGYIQYNVFQNPNDKKLRFTSNHTSPYNTSQKIVSLRFRLKTTCINESDFLKIANFLNGDVCSLKMEPKTVCGIVATEDSHPIFNSIPNPLNGDISLPIIGTSSVAIYNTQGVALYEYINRLSSEGLVNLPMGSLANGVYFICYRYDNKVFSKRIIVLNN